MSRLTLVTGGARSGKSRHACRGAAECGPEVLFLATCAPRDGAMRARVERHRAERPATWTTREVPRGLAGALEPGFDAAIVDCLTLLVSQMLVAGASEDDVHAEVSDLIAAPRPYPLFVVTNEVGSGVHPAGELALRFVDAQGRANQLVAEAADEVVLVVSGIPVPVKGGAAAARAGA